jgi:quinoprotein glucose dehydrogenase
VRSIRPRPSAAAGIALLVLALASSHGTMVGAQRQPARATPAVDWKTYGADLASTRYSPLDQINKDNFSRLKVAWQIKTNDFGPRPDTLYSATPLFVGNVLYTTAGHRPHRGRAESGDRRRLWKHVEDEGRADRTRRAAAPARSGVLVERRRAPIRGSSM